jgi:hypothetical protein
VNGIENIDITKPLANVSPKSKGDLPIDKPNIKLRKRDILSESLLKNFIIYFQK